MKVLIRVDSSIYIGSGHVMRCLTLARVLVLSGHEVVFVCRLHKGNLCSYIEKNGFKVIKLSNDISEDKVKSNNTLYHADWLSVSSDIDAEETKEIIIEEEPDWLIIDHYAIDIQWEKIVRPYIKKILVIDDIADRKHDCDVLLDQNYYFNKDMRYKGLIPENCITLLGPRFALLRDEFSNKDVRVREDIKRIFAFLGGSDPTNETKKVIDAFLQLDKRGLELDIVVGSSNPHKNSLKELCEQYPNINYYIQVDNIAELMIKSDLAVGAGGTTTWERCSLGLPSLVVTIAKNQEEITENVEKLGLIINLGKSEELTWEHLFLELKKIIADNKQIKNMSLKSRALVDGKGARRVVSVMNKFRVKYKITIISDFKSWINQYLPKLIQQLRYNHDVKWIHNCEDINEGDFLFILSYSKIIAPHVLALNKHNLVVHESDLPKGKGWSPLTWQIIQGENKIPIVLFEASEKVDAGVIYLKKIMRFNGLELVDELRKEQVNKTMELCLDFVNQYPDILETKKNQTGNSTYYPRRRPQDSKLNIEKSIKEQFNLLRTVDNEKYPAYFEINHQKYKLKIEKMDD